MANIKSSEKRAKIIKIKTLRNRMVKSGVKTALKNFEAALAQGNLDSAKALYPQITKKIDMATSKGIFHKNAANRMKSKLAIRLNRAAASI